MQCAFHATINEDHPILHGSSPFFVVSFGGDLPAALEYSTDPAETAFVVICDAACEQLLDRFGPDDKLATDALNSTGIGIYCATGHPVGLDSPQDPDVLRKSLSEDTTPFDGNPIDPDTIRVVRCMRGFTVEAFAIKFEALHEQLLATAFPDRSTHLEAQAV